PNKGTRQNLSNAGKEKRDRENRKDDESDAATDLVGANDPGAGKSGDGSDDRKGEAHAREQRKSAATEGLVGARKNEWKDRQNARARDGQNASDERQEIKEHR